MLQCDLEKIEKIKAILRYPFFLAFPFEWSPRASSRRPLVPLEERGHRGGGRGARRPRPKDGIAQERAYRRLLSHANELLQSIRAVNI